MEEHNAKVKKANLGLEDHGIPTSYLHMSWDSSGQGFGGLNLKAPGAMLTWVMGVQSALGLSDWSEVQGTVCRIRREDGKIVAIGHILENRWFTLDDMSNTTEKEPEMGDRSNVFIQQEENAGQWSGIGLYSHWGGEDMQATALQAAVDSLPRLGDESYFTRRVIHKILNSVDPEAAETGHGLWTEAPPDNEYPVLVINSITGAYWYVPDGITDNGVHHVHLPAPAETKNLQ